MSIMHSIELGTYPFSQLNGSTFELNQVVRKISSERVKIPKPDILPFITNNVQNGSIRVLRPPILGHSKVP